jgi:hypothetical protein
MKVRWRCSVCVPPNVSLCLPSGMQICLLSAAAQRAAINTLSRHRWCAHMSAQERIRKEKQEQLQWELERQRAVQEEASAAPAYLVVFSMLLTRFSCWLVAKRSHQPYLSFCLSLCLCVSDALNV